LLSSPGRLVDGGSRLVGNALQVLRVRGRRRGGLQKLLSSLQSQGAGDKAQSWVSTGENMAITPQELEQAVGSEIEQIAQQAGASPEETKEVLAQALPQVVDKVTPNGQIPDQAQLDDMLGQLFGQK
jgi:uncharacterized protein YidB (DUF937 family)